LNISDDGKVEKKGDVRHSELKSIIGGSLGDTQQVIALLEKRIAELTNAQSAMAEVQSRPKRVIRDANGRISGVETVDL